MPAIRPRPPQSSASAPERARMSFQWVKCPKHKWLGVSALVVGDLPPLCMPEGPTHSVGLAELEGAA